MDIILVINKRKINMNPIENNESNNQFCFNKNQKNVLYIDANNMIFRAFHAAKATNNNPIHILTNMIYSLKSKIPHDYAFAIFDGKNNRDSRLEIYPEYKSNRDNKDDSVKNEIKNLKERIYQTFEVLGCVTYESNGIEADDVIGILSLRSAKKGWNVIAVSSDKDYNQLCQYSPYINIYRPSYSYKKVEDNSNKKNKIANDFTITNQKNFAKFGIPITAVVDFLSLTGDKSDGIEGVNKVGEKIAMHYLKEFNSIEGIMKNIDSIKGSKTKANIIEAYESRLLERNQKLISFHFHKDYLVNIPKEKIKPADIYIEELDKFCIENNLKQFSSKYIQPLMDMKEYVRSPELTALLKSKVDEYYQNQKQEQKPIQTDSEKPTKYKPF